MNIHVDKVYFELGSLPRSYKSFDSNFQKTICNVHKFLFDTCLVNGARIYNYKD